MPTPADPPRGHRRRHEAGTRALLDDLAQGNPDDQLSMSDLLAGLGRRAFGMLLFVAALPAFIPIPIGGAISGPIVMLIGVQLVLGLRKPWLPGFLARRGPHRHAVARFDRMISPWLARLEHLIRPRLEILLDSRLAAMLTGAMLLFIGFLLSLPIPLTNYLFGGLVLLFALGLLERDGVLVLLAWIGGIAAVVPIGLLSGNLAAQVAAMLDRLF